MTIRDESRRFKRLKVDGPKGSKWTVPKSKKEKLGTLLPLRAVPFGPDVRKRPLTCKQISKVRESLC